MRLKIVFVLISILLATAGSFGRATADEKARTAPPTARKKVAAVVTLYRHNTHADVIVSRILEGYDINGRPPKPSVDLASIYIDQLPGNDIGRPLAEKHSVPVYDTVEGALTLGTGELAVDGVLLVCEHGSYPRSATDQVEYPKRRLFQDVLRVFESSKRVVPVFSDKHLSDNWTDAEWMYEATQRKEIPFMAGSSLPSYRRLPAADVERDAKLREIVSVGFGGIESYGFHALEAMQCLVERRAGGETGVKSVRCLMGDEVWEAGENGVYDRELLAAALAHASTPIKLDDSLRKSVAEPAAFIIEFRDGTRGSVILLGGAVVEFLVSWRYQEKERIAATQFAVQNERPYSHFAYLLKGIETMVNSGKPTWPAERTLLTTGVLHAAMQSRLDAGARVDTPHLDIRYRSQWDWTQPPAPRPSKAR